MSFLELEKAISNRFLLSVQSIICVYTNTVLRKKIRYLLLEMILDGKCHIFVCDFLFITFSQSLINVIGVFLRKRIVK